MQRGALLIYKQKRFGLMGTIQRQSLSLQKKKKANFKFQPQEGNKNRTL